MSPGTSGAASPSLGASQPLCVEGWESQLRDEPDCAPRERRDWELHLVATQAALMDRVAISGRVGLCAEG